MPEIWGYLFFFSYCCCINREQWDYLGVAAIYYYNLFIELHIFIKFGLFNILLVLDVYGSVFSVYHLFDA
jgi:hypothetical protein